MASKWKFIRIVPAIVAVLATIVLFGMASILQRSTFVAWRKPVALALGLPLKRPTAFLTGLKSVVINYTAGSIFAFAVLLGGFYILNYYKADDLSTDTCVATVQRRYTEEHYRNKRISRNRYVRGEKYTVYCIDLEFTDGTTKKKELTPGDYRKVRQGAAVDISVQAGFFGIPVIREVRLFNYHQTHI